MDKLKVLGDLYFAHNRGKIVLLKLLFYDRGQEEQDFIKETERDMINVYDLMSGIDFVRDVENNCINDYDGSMANIIVDGFKSNLGIFSDNFNQGEFMVSIKDFKKLCKKFDIRVNWANK